MNGVHMSEIYKLREREKKETVKREMYRSEKYYV